MSDSDRLILGFVVFVLLSVIMLGLILLSYYLEKRK